jgi:Flp pilus assembly protein TadD
MKRCSYLTPAAILLGATFLVVSDLRGWFVSKPLEEGQKAMAEENYVQAIRDFSKAQRFCDNDVAARYLLGAAYHNYGWHDEALKQYETAWTLAAENGARAMHSTGRIWAQRRDWDRAASCFQRALSLKPESPDIWYELGIAQRAAGRPDAAQAAFHEAARLNPGNAEFRRAAEGTAARPLPAWDTGL